MIKHYTSKLKSGIIKTLYTLPARWPVYWVDFNGDELVLNLDFMEEPELKCEKVHRVKMEGLCEHTRYLAYHNQEKDQISVLLVPLHVLIDKEKQL